MILALIGGVTVAIVVCVAYNVWRSYKPTGWKRK